MTPITLDLLKDYLTDLQDCPDCDEAKNMAVQIILAYIDDYKVRLLVERLFKKSS